MHADVLRTPPQSTLLATSLGTGMQLLCMAFISVRVRVRVRLRLRRLRLRLRLRTRARARARARARVRLANPDPHPHPNQIACAMLGFLSPANRGSMLTVTLLLFVLMGCVAGYRLGLGLRLG